MRIDQYIHDLLLEHDCVSIPGFGGLVAQHFRAEINHGTNVFRPPSKRISYHKELVANSHLILNKVVKEERISPAKASEAIAAVTASWLQDLENGDSVKLNGIGRFYLDKEQHICFNQSLESNFDLESFGLDIFRATAIKRDAEIKEAVTTAIVDNYKKSNKRFPFWRAAAVFSGTGALLTLGFFKSDVSIPTDITANFNPLKIFETTAQTEAEEKGAADEADNTVHFEDVVVEDTPLAIDPERTTPDDTDVAMEPAREVDSYEVVVGSFKDISNADDLLLDLRTRGYDPIIIKDNTAFTKVSIEGFSSRVEAVQAMRAYKLSVHKGAWIYKR